MNAEEVAAATRERFSIPPSWVWIDLSEVTPRDSPVIYGILQPGSEQAEGVPYVRPTEMQDDTIQLGEVRRTTPEIAEKYRRARLKSRDVLLSIVGTVGKVAIVPEPLEGANITQSSVRIRPKPETAASEYVAWALRSPQLTTQYDALMLGTAVRRLNVEDVRQLQIPLAPLRQQRAIAGELDSQLTRLRASVAEVKASRARLAAYRAAVLRAACEGRLVPTEAELARAEGTGPVARSAVVNHSEIGEAQRAIMARVLPAGWQWQPVEALGADDEQAVLTGPFGSHLGGADFTEAGTPVITISCLTQSGIALEKAMHVSEGTARRLNRYQLKRGDLLFSRMASVGRVGFVTERLAGALFNYHIMRLRLGQMIHPDFFLAYVRGARAVSDYLLAVNHGATRDGINTAQLLGMPVALPPLQEQRRIVAEVERRLSVVERLEAAIDANLARAKRLRQAILKRAFEGRLVPQDPTDEPASVLLERIRRERETMKAEQSRSRRPRNSRERAA